ncbi:SH3 domain-binding protein 5-like [Trichonephila clavipes]|nr:SH3 domain-binding protein 5-like [Trichonephila clavipes]
MSNVDKNGEEKDNETKNVNNDDVPPEELVDPRVQVELERLNTATDAINKLEIELDDARANFRLLLSESSVRVNQLANKLGACVEKARPYYEARMHAKQLQTQTQKAALRYERASSAHSAAKEMVYLAEEGLKKEGRCFDPAWQEMLNHATLRVNEAESERVLSQHEHQKTSLAYNEAEKIVQHLHQELRKSIVKSSLSTRRSLLQLNNLANQHQLQLFEANPQVYVETLLHPEKLTVWCALWAGGIIGPYFKNDEGHNVTVNGNRYRAMITNFFIPELNNHDVQELWFQQDGATCHTARATIDLLKDTFGDRLISRFGPVNRPPISCDLTPLDYFLWGYVKLLVYADKPQTLDHLEDNIRRVIADIRPQMLEKVIEDWTASRGSHMPEIIFKM